MDDKNHRDEIVLVTAGSNYSTAKEATREMAAAEGTEDGAHRAGRSSACTRPRRPTMKIQYIVGPYAAKYDGARSYLEGIVLWPHRMCSPVLAAITRASKAVSPACFDAPPVAP